MKGIVVEINQKDAVILTNDGLFQIVRNHSYEIGQTIVIKKERKIASRFIAGAASMAAAFAVCTVGAVAYYTPSDYVSLDINPSIEYSVNMFDRILDVKAVNDDGEKILGTLDLDNMDIDDAILSTLEEAIAEGYLTDDPDGKVVVATSNEKMKDAKQLASELEEVIRSYLVSRDDVYAVVEATAVKPAKVKEAKERGVTPGKLNLVEKLQESTSGAIVVDEWVEKPVKEINKAIKENRKAAKEEKKALKTNNGKNDATETDAGLDEKVQGKPEKSNQNDGKDQNGAENLSEDPLTVAVNDLKNNGNESKNRVTDLDTLYGGQFTDDLDKKRGSKDVRPGYGKDKYNLQSEKEKKSKE